MLWELPCECCGRRSPSWLFTRVVVAGRLRGELCPDCLTLSRQIESAPEPFTMVEREDLEVAEILKPPSNATILEAAKAVLGPDQIFRGDETPGAWIVAERRRRGLKRWQLALMLRTAGYRWGRSALLGEIERGGWPGFIGRVIEAIKATRGMPVPDRPERKPLPAGFSFSQTIKRERMRRGLTRTQVVALAKSDGRIKQDWSLRSIRRWEEDGARMDREGNRYMLWLASLAPDGKLHYGKLFTH